MKKALIGFLIFAVVLVVCVVVVGSVLLGSIIKAGVEKVGPQFTKTAVKLDSAGVQLLAGSGSVKGLVIGNPEGYKSPYAIKVGSASLGLEPKSLLSDKIHITRVVVEGPEISFEGGLTGKNNLTKLLENVQASTGGSTAKDAGKSSGPGKKIRIDELVITGGKVNVALGIGPLGGTQVAVPLSDIRMTGLGAGTDGLTGAEVTQRVLTEVVNGVLASVTKNGSSLTKPFGEAGKSATEGAAKTLKGLLGK